MAFRGPSGHVMGQAIGRECDHDKKNGNPSKGRPILTFKPVQCVKCHGRIREYDVSPANPELGEAQCYLCGWVMDYVRA